MTGGGGEVSSLTSTTGQHRAQAAAVLSAMLGALSVAVLTSTVQPPFGGHAAAVTRIALAAALAAVIAGTVGTFLGGDVRRGYGYLAWMGVGMGASSPGGEVAVRAVAELGLTIAALVCLSRAGHWLRGRSRGADTGEDRSVRSEGAGTRALIWSAMLLGLCTSVLASLTRIWTVQAEPQTAVGVASKISGVLMLATLYLVARSRPWSAPGGMRHSNGRVWMAMWIILLSAAGGITPWRQPREDLKAAQCLSDTHVLAQALLIYADKHDGRLPAAAGWCDAIRPYLLVGGILSCPSRPELRCGYAFNAALGGARVWEVASPERTVLVFESDRGWNAAGGRGLLPEAPRHLGGDCYAFLDVHTTWIAREHSPGFGVIASGAGSKDQPATITAGPATISLQLVKGRYDDPDSEVSQSPMPPANVAAAWWPEHYRSSPPRTIVQAVSVGDTWLAVARMKEGVDLFELRAGWSHGRPVIGFSEPRGRRRYITLVPDRGRRRTMVLAQHESGPGRSVTLTDVSVLDLARAPVDLVYQFPQDGPAAWAGDDIVVAYRPTFEEDVVTLIDPATRGAREIYRERADETHFPIASLWPSPRGSRVALGRSPVNTMWSAHGARNVVVIDTATGRGVPVAYDSRQDYYHRVVKWESEDSLLLRTGEGNEWSRVYRAKLRPAHADRR